MPSVIFFALPLTFAILVLVRGKEKKKKATKYWCSVLVHHETKDTKIHYYFYCRTDQKWDILDCT